MSYAQQEPVDSADINSLNVTNSSEITAEANKHAIDDSDDEKTDKLKMDQTHTSPSSSRRLAKLSQPNPDTTQTDTTDLLFDIRSGQNSNLGKRQRDQENSKSSNTIRKLKFDSSPSRDISPSIIFSVCHSKENDGLLFTINGV